MLFVWRWKILEILLAAFLLTAPSFLAERAGTGGPNWARSHAALALDQQGGAGVQASDQQDSTPKETPARPAKLEFRLVNVSMTAEQALQGGPPVDAEILYGRQRPNEPKVPYLVETSVLFSEADIVDAEPALDRRSGEAIVSFRLSRDGGRKFAFVTQQNVGRPFAIILDHEVISAPVIREPILGGSGQISGRFTLEEAVSLAVYLRSGAPPTIVPNSR
jgi:protein-export membrane protein SecD